MKTLYLCLSLGLPVLAESEFHPIFNGRERPILTARRTRNSATRPEISKPAAC